MSIIRSNHHTILFSSITRYFFFLSHIQPRSPLCPAGSRRAGSAYCDLRRNTASLAAIATGAAIRRSGLRLLRLAPQYGYAAVLCSPCLRQVRAYARRQNSAYCDLRRNTASLAAIATCAAIRRSGLRLLRLTPQYGYAAVLCSPCLRQVRAYARLFWAKHTNRVTSLANPVLAITPSAIPSPIHRLPPKPSRSTSFQTSHAASNS